LFTYLSLPLTGFALLNFLITVYHWYIPHSLLITLGESPSFLLYVPPLP